MPVNPPFHERFEIEMDVAEARRRFLNRVYDYVLKETFEKAVWYQDRDGIIELTAYLLGERKNYFALESYAGNNYYRMLAMLEKLYEALSAVYEHDTERLANFNQSIEIVLNTSESDLGIRWENGIFVRTGARLLDEELVNESLRWLRKSGYEDVYAPFAKGLQHFLQAEQRPELLHDAITDLYESLEALSKVVTGRTGKDLSSNAEMFVSKFKVSKQFRKWLSASLKEYIEYANQFRHAPREQGARPVLTVPEVESFLYQTGVFLRLGIVAVDAYLKASDDPTGDAGATALPGDSS